MEIVIVSVNVIVDAYGTYYRKSLGFLEITFFYHNEHKTVIARKLF